MFSFIYLCQIPVILSIPNKDVLHMNNNSTTSGAGITMMTHINRQTSYPKNPHTLLLLSSKHL